MLGLESGQVTTGQIPEHDRDEYGRPRLGGISQYIAKEIERRTGIETRVTILGHVQRAGTPTASIGSWAPNSVSLPSTWRRRVSGA